MTGFLRIAHRGASGHEPENTLRAIRRALELGANGIEIDLRLSRDGQLVVIHDDTLERTTRTPGRVAERTLEELRRLDAGLGEQIPTLREVLDLVAGRAWLNLELKAAGTALETVREAVCALNRGDWQPGQIVISSFDRRELLTASGALGPEHPVRTGLLLSRPMLALSRFARRYGATSLHLSRHVATAGMIRRAKRAGLRVLVFTVNKAEEIERFRQWGADGVFTDYPELTAPLMGPAILPPARDS